MIEWHGKGVWAGWLITTYHSAASQDAAVLVSPSGQVFTPGDIEKAFRTLLNRSQVAAYLGITRQAVADFERRASRPNYRGKFPKPVERGMWDFADIERYKQEQEQ